MPDLRALAEEDFCYLTTRGRVTGRPHEIEIWFALIPEAQTLYMLSGGGDRSDWVKNLRRNPQVTVRIAGKRFSGRAREARDAEEDELAPKSAARGSGSRDVGVVVGARVARTSGTAAGEHQRAPGKKDWVREVRIRSCRPEQPARKMRKP
jgi:deazaflavin-dependent oxidoreductase (nitroreductase family)